MLKKDKLNLFIIILVAALNYVNFMSSFSLVLMQNYISSPLWFSVLLVVKKILKIALDIPSGVLADRFGAKKLIILSTVFFALCQVAWFVPSVYNIIIGLCLQSVALAFMVGKVEAYIYNILLRNDMLNKYPRYSALMYFVVDILAAIVCFVAPFVYRFGSYSGLSSATIACNVLSLLLLLKLEDIRFRSAEGEYFSFKQIIQNSYNICRSNMHLFYLLIMWGLVNFFGWQFGHISLMVLSEINFSVEQISMLKSVEHFAMSIGCVLTFIFSPFLNFRRAAICLVVAMSVMILSGIVYGKFVIVGIVFYLLLYTSMEVVIMRNIEKNSLNSTRYTITSFSAMMSSMFNIFGTLLIGGIANISSYQVALVSLCVAFMLLSIFSIIGLKNYKE